MSYKHIFLSQKTPFQLKFIFITSGLNSPKDITISQCTRLGHFECVKSLSRKLIHRPARGRSLDLHSAQTYPSAVQSHLDLDSWNDVDVPIIALSSHLTRAHTHSSKQKKLAPNPPGPKPNTAPVSTSHPTCSQNAPRERCSATAPGVAYRSSASAELTAGRQDHHRFDNFQTHCACSSAPLHSPNQVDQVFTISSSA